VLKKILSKLAIHVWGLPTLYLSIIYWLILAVFWLTNTTPDSKYFFEPGGKRELIFTCLIGVMFLCYLWILRQRYNKNYIKLSRFSDGLLIFLTVMCIIGIAIEVFQLIWIRPPL
jgi:hypothetical protein